MRGGTRSVPNVGLVPGGQRRAPGLRREELAMLAGISAEYYLSLDPWMNWLAIGCRNEESAL